MVTSSQAEKGQRYNAGYLAGIAQGLERLSVEEEAAGSRPAIRPK